MALRRHSGKKVYRENTVSALAVVSVLRGRKKETGGKERKESTSDTGEARLGP